MLKKYEGVNCYAMALINASELIYPNFYKTVFYDAIRFTRVNLHNNFDFCNYEYEMTSTNSIVERLTKNLSIYFEEISSKEVKNIFVTGSNLFIAFIDVYYADWIKRYYHKIHSIHTILLNVDVNETIMYDSSFLSKPIVFEEGKIESKLMKKVLKIKTNKHNKSIDKIIKMCWLQTIKLAKEETIHNQFIKFIELFYKHFNNRILQQGGDPFNNVLFDTVYTMTGNKKAFLEYVELINIKNMKKIDIQFKKIRTITNSTIRKLEEIKILIIYTFENGYKNENHQYIYSKLLEVLDNEREMTKLIVEIEI